MAVDEALLKSAAGGHSEAILRLYAWNRPTLSIGYAQNQADINMGYLFGQRIPVVRRPTGGRAVLHANEVTYAVIIPTHSKYFGSLGQVYGFVATALRMALSDCGVTLDDPGTDIAGAPSTACCFATKTRYEITSGGKKIVAGAQRRLASAALQHGSIIMSMDVEKYLSCFHWRDEEKRRRAGNLVGGVNDGRNPPILSRRIAVNVINAFKKLYDIQFEDGDLLANERAAVARLEIDNTEDT